MSSSTTSRGTIQVVMPQMGISVSEGTVTAWHARSGDPIAADQTICEVSTDKIDVEIPAPATGRLGRVIVGEGETVAPSGLSSLARDRYGRRNPPPPKPEPTSRRQKSPERAKTAAQRRGAAGRARSLRVPSRRSFAGSPPITASTSRPGRGPRDRQAYPQRDLLAFMRHGTAMPTTRPPFLHSDSPYQPEEGANGSCPTDGRTPRPERFHQPGATRPMRRAIGRHMIASRRTSAHCTTIAEADFSAVAARRAELRSAGPTHLPRLRRARGHRVAGAPPGPQRLDRGRRSRPPCRRRPRHRRGARRRPGRARYPAGAAAQRRRACGADR